MCYTNTCCLFLQTFIASINLKLIFANYNVYYAVTTFQGNFSYHCTKYGALIVFATLFSPKRDDKVVVDYVQNLLYMINYFILCNFSN